MLTLVTDKKSSYLGIINVDKGSSQLPRLIFMLQKFGQLIGPLTFTFAKGY